MSLLFNNVVIVECELGGPTGGAAYGGRALFTELKNKPKLIDTIHTPVKPIRKSDTPLAHYLVDINLCLKAISDTVACSFKEEPMQKLSIFAGDHSTACGSIAGLKKAFPDKRIGVVWIDAHADIHSPYTSPSGNVHGMPVAAAVGLDHQEHAVNKLDKETSVLWEATKDICDRAFLFEDLVYIGIRDLEIQEWMLIEQHEISYHSVEDVRRFGGNKIAYDTLDYLSHCDLIYVSFDIDSLDSSLVPGTGTPVSKGLDIESARQILEVLTSSEKVNLLEVVEINPLLDNKNETAATIARLFEGVF